MIGTAGNIAEHSGKLPLRPAPGLKAFLLVPTAGQLPVSDGFAYPVGKAKRPLVTFRADGIGIGRIAERGVIDHAPAAALYQALQTDAGKNPIVCRIVIRFSFVDQIGDREPAEIVSLARSESGDASGQDAVAGARQQRLQNTEGILQVIENTEKQGYAALGIGQGEIIINVLLDDFDFRMERRPQRPDALHPVEIRLRIINGYHLAAERLEEEGDMTVAAADIQNRLIADQVQQKFSGAGQKAGQRVETA